MTRAARARSAKEKTERAESLVAAARELLGDEAYTAVSVQAIASRAGVAKGTVFLYYPTKEALALAVLESLLGEWWTDLALRLEALERPASPSTVAAAARRSLEGRAELLRLIVLMAGVLEANGGSEAVAAFRQTLRQSAGDLGGILETVLPFLRRGEGLEVALTLHALVLGISQMAPGRSDRALAAEEMAPFRVDVPGAVGRTLRVQLEGAKAVSELTTSPPPELSSTRPR